MRLQLIAPVSLVLAVAACSAAQQAAVKTATVDAAVCALNHFSDPPATIVAECGLSDISDVEKIFTAATAMQTRKAAMQKSVAP